MLLRAWGCQIVKNLTGLLLSPLVRVRCGADVGFGG